MLTFRDITPQDEGIVMPMVEAFYHSDAVDHEVSQEILARAFRDAADQEEPLLRGVLILEDGKPAGYLYLTFFYAAEVGGRCVMIEEIFFLPQYRGRGLGRETLEWLRKEYPKAKRFRLEVTEVNESAVHLYQGCGYQWLDYKQMVLDLV